MFISFLPISGFAGFAPFRFMFISVKIRSKMNVIVAACEGDLGIGKGGTLPWLLKKELQYFAFITKHVIEPGKQNAVIMGRKTWESIPQNRRPLKSRINIVLSTTMKCGPNDGYYVYSSLQNMLNDCQKQPLKDLIESIWIIGGSSVYEEAMSHPQCKRLYITWIKKKFDCDTFLPKIPDNFEEMEDDRVPQGLQEENDIQYEIKVYKRVEQ